jgi:phosphatidylglycerophosphatase A
MTTSKPETRAKPNLSHPVHFLAFGMGAGCSPKAPGTMGTLVAVAIYLPLSLLPFWAYLATTLVVILAGIWICDWSARQLGVHDHPGIVWDEIAGYLVTMVAVPPGLLWILAGFVLFRFFDILKPWPISWLDKRVGGGLGIMLDDVVAGAAACACLHLLSAWV